MANNNIAANSRPLDFISDEVLQGYVRSVVDRAKKAASTKDIYKNVIDPFSAVFDIGWQGIDFNKWLLQEKSRQIQKSLQNLVGDFHQSVIGSISGWENLKVGHSIDLRSREKKIIAELKNKYNTLNSGGQLAVYDKLQRHLDYDESYTGFTAYCVVIVPKNPNPLDMPFHPTERGTRRPKRQDIRIIDGKSFYSMATGDPDSLLKLYNRIAYILTELLELPQQAFLSSNTFKELFHGAYIK